MKRWITLAIVLGLLNVAIIYLMAKENLHQTELQLVWKIKELSDTKIKYSKCIDDCRVLKNSLK